MLLTGRGVDAALIEKALDEIVESQFFRSSAQCSALLRYIVQNTLAEREEYLRERVIGAEVFGRRPDYDTGNDHIVRSRASEVRKRLAQFYQGVGDTTQLRITIPSGSYRATFDTVSPPPIGARVLVSGPLPPLETILADQPTPIHVSSAQAQPEEPESTRGESLLPPPTRLRRVAVPKLVLVTAVLFIALGCVGALIAKAWLIPSRSAFNAFWAPLNRSSRPALIYCGGGFVYKLSDQFLDAYRLKHGSKEARREFFVDLKPGETVPGPDLIPDKHFVPFGDLASTARVVATLSSFKKPYDLRYGEDLAFTEFRNSPVILIGGLNNSWALKVTHNLRYALDQDDRIVDQWHREKVWTQTADPENQARDDYAIVTRLSPTDNGAGSFVLSIAGIRMYGTRAAAELVSDPARLDVILKDLPRGWETKNLQVVLHTKTLNEIPVSVNVEAIHSW